MIITNENQLRVKSDPIRKDEVEEIANKLKEVLKEHKEGLAVSAIQIGIPKRIFIMRTDKEGEYYTFVNPRITDAYDEIIFPKEGCLSFPGVFITTKRFHYVQLQDDERSRLFSGTMAVAVQHEMDHANGVLMFDRKFTGVKVDKKPGRNDPCSCNSGKKFKKCCGRNNESIR